MTSGPRRWLVLALGTAACEAGDLSVPPEDPPCHEEALAEGEILVAGVACAEELLGGGEGRVSDTILANSRFRAIVRHPQDAATVLGVGGGTVVDAAPWGLRDRLHEAVPLVSGGWIDVEEMTVEDARIVLGGPIRSFPDRPAADVGAWREVAWRVEPDDPWLYLDGADGLYLHGAGAIRVLDGHVYQAELVYGTDRTAVEDLGGALRLEGVTRLLIAPRSEAATELAERPRRLEGRAAEGAIGLELFRGDELVGWHPLGPDRAFDLAIDGAVDGVRAETPGRAPAARVPPGTGLTVPTNPRGVVHLGVAWRGPRPRWVRVDWFAANGRSGAVIAPSDGGDLALGSGAFRLVVSAGPAVEAREVEVDVPADRTVPVGVVLEPRFDPGPRVLARIGAPSDGSRLWRGSDATALASVAAGAVDYAVFTLPDDVSAAFSGGVDPTLRIAVAGAWAPAREGAGWNVWSWPWSRSGGNAHGMVDIAGLSPGDALAVMWGGGTDRLTAVDAAFLATAGPPEVLDPQPDFLVLDDPGPAGPDQPGWRRWFEWLDAGAPLVPLGPATWIEVGDPARYAQVDVEQGLIAGRVCAGSGPLLDLRLRGGTVGPGDVVDPDALEPIDTRVRLRGAAGIDHLALVGDGRVLAAWEVGGDELDVRFDDPAGTRWVVAMAWSDEGGAWAATGPVWLSPPGVP